MKDIREHKVLATLLTLPAALLLGTLGLSASTLSEAAAKEKANCELRMVSQAGAGEIFMSIFTPNEQSCLSKADSEVEAKFRNSMDEVVSIRGGGGALGPQP